MTDPHAISIDDLVVGETTETSLHDADGNLMVASGVEITKGLIARFKHRGVNTVYRWRAPSQPPAGGEVSKARPASGETPSRPPEPASSPKPYSRDQVQRIEMLLRQSEVLVEQLARSLRSGGSIDTTEMEEAVDGFIGELAQDPDPVLAGALHFVANLKLATRCVQFSVLSMAVGMRCDVSGEDLQTLGAAAIMHDWPLLDLPIHARFPHQKMSKSERQHYIRHPLDAKQMLDAVPGTSSDAKLLVTQVHELMDGSGFPRGLAAAQIHPMSRILCVADAYLTLTSPPKGFPRVVPCDAVAYLVSGASRGQYSPKAVTGLLNALTMYPLGSIVELSDASQARVIRSNGKDYGSPVVQSLGPSETIIDLKTAGVFITRPVLSGENQEVRLPDTYQELHQMLRRTPV
jgi:hypothetical protein